MTVADEVLDLIGTFKTRGAPFAVATVVRTVSMTAAKAGAKAVIGADGSISAGWIGGGCARGAVLRAARDAIADGRPRLVSVQPIDALRAQGVQPGESRDGLEFAKNMCPSQGTMDVFVEPFLPRPELLVCGATPVAIALAELAPRFGYGVRVAAPEADQVAFASPDARAIGYAFDDLADAERYIVVATQGKGDEQALRAALNVPSCYVGFIGSRRKVAQVKVVLAE